MLNWGTVIPLIGGMTIGNKKAVGSDPNFLISYPAFADNDAHAKAYFKETPFILLDDEKNDWSNEQDANYIKGLGDVDFVSTVCPCAGLSSLNPNSNADAVQNDWMYKTADFVLEKLKPKVFWGENAPTLFTNKGTKVKNNLVEIGKKWGYTFSIAKTNSIKHGIPQKRERTFYFFWRDTNPPIFNEISKGHKPILEYLKEIPADASMQDIFSNNDYNTNGFIQWIKDNPSVLDEFKNSEKKYGRTMRTMFHYLKWDNKFEDFKQYFKEKKLDKFYRLVEHAEKKVNDGKNIWDSTPKMQLYVQDYINAIQGRIFHYTVHPNENRYLNIREYMHLMGLPSDFELAHKKNLNHICQNVPVNTAADWTGQVIDYLKGSKKLHTDIYFEFNNTTGTDDDSDSCSVKLF
jgi:site-specific DNA-cytosine methylase